MGALQQIEVLSPVARVQHHQPERASRAHPAACWHLPLPGPLCISPCRTNDWLEAVQQAGELAAAAV